jgi:hypothetical protein
MPLAGMAILMSFCPLSLDLNLDLDCHGADPLREATGTIYVPILIVIKLLACERIFNLITIKIFLF